jgi:hypothetical protein
VDCSVIFKLRCDKPVGLTNYRNLANTPVINKCSEDRILCEVSHMNRPEYRSVTSVIIVTGKQLNVWERILSL